MTEDEFKYGKPKKKLSLSKRLKKAWKVLFPKKAPKPVLGNYHRITCSKFMGKPCNCGAPTDAKLGP